MYAAIHPVLKKIYPEEKQFYYPPRKKLHQFHGMIAVQRKEFNEMPLFVTLTVYLFLCKVRGRRKMYAVSLER